MSSAGPRAVRNRSAARTSVLVSFLSVGVLAVSFGNQLIIARTFGASQALDGYLLASSVPLLVSGAVGGVFSYAMVPALSRHSSEPAVRSRLSGAFFWTFVVLAAGVACVGWAVAPLGVGLLSAGAMPSQLPLLIRLTRFGWAVTALGVGVGFSTAVLNVHGRFLLPVSLSLLPYLSSAVAVLFYGRDIGIEALAIGLLIGTALSALMLAMVSYHFLQLRGLARSDFAAVRQFAASAPLALLSVLTFSAFQSIDSYWAPQLGPSNLSVLGYCQRLFIAIGSVISAGPSIILQPRLAAASASGDNDGFLRDLGRGLKLTVLVCAPVALWLAWLAGPIVRVAFERGSFDRSVTVAVAGVLPFMLFSMIPSMCTVLLFKALYARKDMATAVMLGITGPVLYFTASGVLLRFGLAGISAAFALTWTTVAVLGIARVWRPVGVLSSIRQFAREFVQLIAAAAISALVSGQLLASWKVDPVGVVLGKLACAGVLTVVTCAVVAVRVARIEDLRHLFFSIVRRSNTG